MFWNLLFGILAGWLTPKAEPHIKDALVKIAQRDLPFGETEYDVLSLLVMLILASLLVAIVGGDSMAFLLLIGAFAGLFGKQIVGLITLQSGRAENPGTGKPYSADGDDDDTR
ncbi:hypothetical protein HKCCE3408_17945 [Rhodobacterales bacterium HKCCE3408]|nr:hypothetical protein [Rhodobacterales bacterium HKCCE3408]